jgi:hypothetical protein
MLFSDLAVSWRGRVFVFFHAHTILSSEAAEARALPERRLLRRGEHASLWLGGLAWRAEGRAKGPLCRLLRGAESCVLRGAKSTGLLRRAKATGLLLGSAEAAPAEAS